MKHVDILIIGQGLAGTLLSYFLTKRNVSHHIVDPNHTHSASMVAAGLMDAISGKRFTLSWNSDTFIPFAKETYREFETFLNTSFYHEAPSLRLFSTAEEAHFFEKKHLKPEFEGHYGERISIDHDFPFIKQHHGGVWINTTSALHTEICLKTYQTYLKTQNQLSHATFHPTSWEGPFIHDGIQAKRLIFCTGAGLKNLPFLAHLPFRPAQGETLTFKNTFLPTTHVTNLGKWFVPGKNDTIKFGATYEWENLTPTPTQKGKELLLSFLKDYVNTPDAVSESIINHQAGIRMMVSDLKPLAGFLPDLPSIGILGGFGSKGVMFAPYYAHQLAESICK